MMSTLVPTKQVLTANLTPLGKFKSEMSGPMPSGRILVMLACAAIFSALLHAQDSTAISVKLLDGKTGDPVKASNFLVLVDHHDTIHPEWVKINDDGTVIVTLPPDAKEFSIKATYDMGMDIFINCDAAKEAHKERDIWYPISMIVKSGIVAPDECGTTNFTAKPGEFIFFVRKRDWRDHPDE